MKARLETVEAENENLKELAEEQEQIIQEQKQLLNTEAPGFDYEDSDEDDDEDEDDIVPQTRARQTILSAKIMPEFALLSNKAGAVEDSLFDEVNISTDKVRALLLSDPLHSYLLSMDSNAYDSTRKYMGRYLKETAEKIEIYAEECNRLTNVHIPSISAERLHWDEYVRNQKRNLETLERRLEASQQELAGCADRYKLLEDQKEEFVADIQKMEKAMKVADVLLEIMEQLSNSHWPSKHTRKLLPLGNVESANDDSFNAFKEKCGLTDYGSTKRSIRDLLAINRATTMLGLQYSPYFIKNEFPPLRLGRSSKGKGLGSDLRYRICEVFQIPIPTADENVAVAATFKSRKRKRKSSTTLAPGMKKCKNNGGVPTKEHVNAMLNSPELRKLVLESPQIKRALASSSKKKRNGD